MPTLLERLQTALADRYAIKREIEPFVREARAALRRLTGEPT